MGDDAMSDPSAALRAALAAEDEVRISLAAGGRTASFDLRNGASFVAPMADLPQAVRALETAWGVEDGFLEALRRCAEGSHSKAFDALAGWTSAEAPAELRISVASGAGEPLVVVIGRARRGVSGALARAGRRLGGRLLRLLPGTPPWPDRAVRTKARRRLAMLGLRIDWRHETLRRVVASDTGVFRLHVSAVLARAAAVASAGDLLWASRIVGSLQSSVSFPIVEDALYALAAAAESRPVPATLGRFLGRHDGHLGRVYCVNPFRQFDLQAGGETLVCCGHFLPLSIGNVLEDPDVFNSATARKIRKSVTDGSFDHCFLSRCHSSLSGGLPNVSEMDDDVAASVASGFSVASPRSVTYGLDETCNLSCPSCRTDLIVAKSADQDRMTEVAETSIAPLLPGARDLLINSAGEFLASKSSRRLLETISRETHPNLTVNIITNGTLFTPAEWAHLSNVHGMVGYIRVSVDAATGPTFQALRRKGEWSRFSENMGFIAGLRREGAIRELQVAFTYQAANLDEMEAFVAWGRGLGADRIIFERLQNLTYRGTWTEEEYRERAVHLPSHPRYGDFQRIVSKPEFRDGRVQIDL